MFDQFEATARSPEVNSKENNFHPARKKLSEDASKQAILKETFEKFSSRVKHTIENIHVATITRMVDFINKRMRLIIKGRGNRTNY